MATHHFTFDAQDLDCVAAAPDAPADERFRAHMMQSGVALKKGDEARALSEAQSAVQASRETGQPVLEAVAFINFGNAMVRFKRLDSAERAYSTSHDVALRAGQPVVAALATVQLAHTHTIQGKLTEAIRGYSTAAAFYERVGMVEPRCSASMYLGDVLGRLALDDKSVDTWKAAIDALDAAKLTEEQSTATRTQLLIRLARAHARRGEAEDAEKVRRALASTKAENTPLIEIG